MSYDGFSSQELMAFSRSNKMNYENSRRFVILWHAMPNQVAPPRASHFDLMFENDEHLITFELPKLPIPGERIPICRLKDHRLHFLDFQGPLDRGANAEDRGHVTQWTTGTYHHYRWSEQKLIVELTSSKLSARIVLLPGKIANGAIDTRSPIWPGVIRWELRVPRWELKKVVTASAPMPG